MKRCATSATARPIAETWTKSNRKYKIYIEEVMSYESWLKSAVSDEVVMIVMGVRVIATAPVKSRKGEQNVRKSTSYDSSKDGRSVPKTQQSRS